MTFTKGEIVHLDPAAAPRFAGKDWKVDRVNPVTLRLVPAEGTGRGLVADKSFVLAGPAPERGATVTPVPVPDLNPLPGTVIRIIGGKAAGGLYVVTGETAKGVRAFPLGGSDRYLTNLRRVQYEIIPVSSLAAALGN